MFPLAVTPDIPMSPERFPVGQWPSREAGLISMARNARGNMGSRSPPGMLLSWDAPPRNPDRAWPQLFHFCFPGHASIFIAKPPLRSYNKSVTYQFGTGELAGSRLRGDLSCPDPKPDLDNANVGNECQKMRKKGRRMERMALIWEAPACLPFYV